MFFFSLTRVVELEEQIKREKDQADLLLEQQRLVWQSNNLLIVNAVID